MIETYKDENIIYLKPSTVIIEGVEYEIKGVDLCDINLYSQSIQFIMPSNKS